MTTDHSLILSCSVLLQRLKAALHHSVGKVCAEVERAEFSREVIAAVTEAAFNQSQLLAWDAEAFAKLVDSSLHPFSLSYSLPSPLSLSYSLPSPLSLPYSLPQTCKEDSDRPRGRAVVLSP